MILVPPGEESVAEEVIRASPGEKWEGEVVRVRKGGGKFLAHLTVTLIRSVDQQEVVGRVVVHRDLTKRTRVKEALRRSETRYRALLNAIPDSMFLITREGTILDYVSTENLLALASDAWLGKHVSEVLPADFTRQLMHCMERTLTTDAVQVLEFQIPVSLQDEDPRDCEARLVVSGEDEVLAIVRDVTERKRLERQLLQAQKIEAVGMLASGVAHDFNNLLTPIMSYAELAAGALPSESHLRPYLHEIRKAAERASHLTRQLLAFSRRQIIEPQVFDLNDLVLNLDKLLRRLIGEDIELVTLPSIHPGIVKVDPGQMEQVLVNLSVNARDAMPHGGKLSVATGEVTLDDDYARRHPEATPGRYVMIVVGDTGIGMTHEVKDHIFEPFFTTKDPGQGTGLGLSTCYGIVAQAGGHMTVVSEPGQGTTFKIYLPAVQENARAPPLRDAPAKLPFGTETVLVVEDEPSVRAVASRLLRRQGYSVLEAANGQEALSLAQAHADEEIHLLLADVVMPLMGGMELAQQLAETHPGARVLFTSGYTDDAIVNYGDLNSGTEFMQKPFTQTTLAHRVREVLEK